MKVVMPADRVPDHWETFTQAVLLYRVHDYEGARSYLAEAMRGNSELGVVAGLRKLRRASNMAILYDRTRNKRLRNGYNAASSERNTFPSTTLAGFYPFRASQGFR